MKHNLFHTLVLTGAALVGGCAANVVSPSDPLEATREPAAINADAAVEDAQLTAASAATSPSNTQAPSPETEAARAMVADARACRDSGWSTTKSASSLPRTTVTVDGHTYSCLPEYANRTPRCCRQDPTR